MKVFIQSTILAGKQHEILNTKVSELNERLKAFATQNNSITFIDLNAGLANNSLLNSRYSREGIHLNGSGYTVWKGIINPYLQ